MAQACTRQAATQRRQPGRSGCGAEEETVQQLGRGGGGGAGVRVVVGARGRWHGRARWVAARRRRARSLARHRGGVRGGCRGGDDVGR